MKVCRNHLIPWQDKKYRMSKWPLILFRLLALALLMTIGSQVYADSSSILPRFVTREDGQRHPYYNLTTISSKLPVQTKFFPERQGGIVFFQSTNQKKIPLFYLLHSGRYKANTLLLHSTWPVLHQKSEIYLPYEMLQEFSRRFFPNQADWSSGYTLTWRTTNQIKPDQPVTATPRKGSDLSSSPPHTTESFIIILDAGHGGKDPGAIFRNRRKNALIQEKDITLDYTQALALHLRKHFPGVKVFLTRNKDTFIDLHERTQIANQIASKHGKAIFISLHVNSSISSRTNGLEIFFLSPNPSNETIRFRKLDRYQNIGNSDQEMGTAEFYLLNAYIISESRKLAGMVASGLRDEIGGSVKMRGIKQADFIVLRGSLMPAVLVELGFLSNSKDRNKLTSKRYRNQIVHALGEALLRYLKVPAKSDSRKKADIS